MDRYDKTYRKVLTAVTIAPYIDFNVTKVDVVVRGESVGYIEARVFENKWTLHSPLGYEMLGRNENGKWSHEYSVFDEALECMIMGLVYDGEVA